MNESCVAGLEKAGVIPLMHTRVMVHVNHCAYINELWRMYKGVMAHV